MQIKSISGKTIYDSKELAAACHPPDYSSEWMPSGPRLAQRLAVEDAVSRFLDLREASLPCVFLRGSKLAGAQLFGADLSFGDLREADLRGADLGSSNLCGANLIRANLRGANLVGANLDGADLSGVDLRGAQTPEAPTISNIHQAIYAAASHPNALQMTVWHEPCGSVHCRAGWVIVLSGKAGAVLECKIDTSAAAALIYFASDPERRVPNFYETNEEALEDMRILAEKEKLKCESNPS